MKFHMNRTIRIRIILLLLLIAIVFLIYVIWDKIMDVAYPFMISIFIAYLLNPIVCVMEKKGIKRSVGIIIIYVTFIVFFLFICFYMVPVIVKDIGKLISNMPGYSTKFRDTILFFQDKYSNSGLPAGIKNALNNNIQKLEDYVTLSLESMIAAAVLLLSKIFSIALIPILLYYFLKDFRQIKERIKLLIPRKYRNKVARIGASIDDIFGSYVRSQIILSLITAVMTAIGLLILKIDFALIIGIINGITNIIPYFGPIIGAIPAVLVALLQSPMKALYTIIVIIIIQQIESDIICPKITADSVGLHPVTVILALVIGGELFGIAGLLLGVPVAAALKIIYYDIAKSLF